MILTVDIGNTTIALGVVQHGKVLDVQRFDTVTDPKKLSKGLRAAVAIFRKKGNMPEVVGICSVVPKISSIVESILIKELDLDVYVAGENVTVPMKNRYRNPRQVGQDRLVGAYAAMKIYGKPLIIIDLGTAITFDVVSAKGEYLGGAIVPGIRLSAESLFLKTALLPKIHIKAPKSIIGRTTEESILSGLFYGYGSLCRGFIELISQQMKARPKVVMTGGHTQLMKRFVSPKIRIIDDDLVHKGIAFLLANRC